MPLAANAFAKGSSLPVIRPARETARRPQTGAYELQFWSAGCSGVRIAQSSPSFHSVLPVSVPVING